MLLSTAGSRHIVLKPRYHEKRTAKVLIFGFKITSCPRPGRAVTRLRTGDAMQPYAAALFTRYHARIERNISADLRELFLHGVVLQESTKIGSARFTI